MQVWRSFREWVLPFSFGLIAATVVGSVNFYFDSQARAERAEEKFIDHDQQLERLVDAVQRMAITQQSTVEVLTRLERQHENDVRELRRAALKRGRYDD